MLRLQAGDSSVVLAPEIGGALVGWTLAGIPVLRRAAPDAIVHGKVGGLAGFPLLPFCNRIAYGRFHWDGRDYQLARNFGDHPHTIHGVGWQSAWSVADVSPASVSLALRHRPDRHWPFAFAAELRLALAERELQVALRLTNQHGAPAPAGLGLHPFFPRATFQTLRFHASGVWLNGPDALPDRHVALPAEWDYRNGRSVDVPELDNCFTGWDGTAELRGAELNLTVQASPNFAQLQVYTPPQQEFFCVEPVSHMPDAINRSADDMRVLASGEQIDAEIVFRLIGAG